MVEPYAEVARVAQTAGDAKAYVDDIGRRSIVFGDGTRLDIDESFVRDARPGGILAAMEHAAWQRPASVFADIEAKRRVVETLVDMDALPEGERVEQRETGALGLFMQRSQV
jgi:hypothetical protein